MAATSCGPGRPPPPWKAKFSTHLIFVWILILTLVVDIGYVDAEATKTCEYIQKFK